MLLKAALGRKKMRESCRWGQREGTFLMEELTVTVGRGEGREITDTFVVSVEASRIWLLTKGEMQGHPLSAGRTTLQGGRGVREGG